MKIDQDKNVDSRFFHKLVSSTVTDEVIQLSESQILMLNMSEEDIKYNRLVAQDELDERDLVWLNSL